ncbi:SDR family NAD(P)-dependent oxidoreductase, partial [Moorena sp. SIO4A5]|uniref:SDR family NAD(P)-dependent oxidoreductase n=1 Tax=Moorena sp. SIO4A5 TaxID=2607838 RepID=UPI0013C71388
TLSTLAKRHSQRLSEQVVLNSMPHPQENLSDMAFALQTLGQLWLTGSSVDWSRVYSEQTCYRIPLPTYPFERQRYWIEQTESYNGLNSATAGISTAKFSSTTSAPPRLVPSNNRSSRSSDPADWFYLPSWKRVSLPYPLASTNSGTCWLVFLDPYGVGVSLVEALQANAETVCVVEIGDRFEKPSVNPNDTETGLPSYRLNPGRAEDYHTLMQDLKTTECWPTQIVHLWTVTAPSTLSDRETFKDRLHNLETIQDLGFYSLVFLAQALGKYDTKSETCQLTAISNGMQVVVGTELNAPEKATVLGPIQIISTEYPHITCRSIDLDFDVDRPFTKSSASKVLAELRTPITEPAIAYRGGYRWVRTFEQVPLPAVNPDQLRLKPQGVYLITGGLGGIGLEIATYLAETVQAKLVLISRSPIPPRATWLQWLAEKDSDNPTSHKIRKVQEMEDLGAEVLICCADVTDYQGMERAIAQAHTQFGGIHGVIHGAGVAGGGLIQLKTRAIATEHMACKLQGTLILDVLLQDCELDFVVLFSTLNTVQPAVGQVDYCAANAFLDAFAWAQTATRDSLTISINWNGWQKVGLAAAAARNPRLAHNYRNFDDFLSPAEGVEAFARILHQPFPQVLVSTTDLQVKLQETRSEFDNHPPDPTPTPTKASLTTAASTPTTTIHSRPNLSIPYIAPRNHDEQTVVEIWQNILGIEPIGINDSFLELGGDSLIATQIVTRLREVMASHLSVASLFETPTIAMLVASVKESRQPKSPTPDSQSNEREEIEL